MSLPEIPQSWLILALLVALCVMRTFGIDTFITAGMASLIGYITGKHVEQTRCEQ